MPYESGGRRIVVSVQIPKGLFREIKKELEEGDHVHLSDFIRAAIRFYIMQRRTMRKKTVRAVVG